MCWKKYKRNKKLLILAIAIFGISFVFSFMMCFLLSPKIEIEKRNLVFSYDEDIVLPKYHAYGFHKNLDSLVVIKNSIPEHKVGKYFVEYYVSYFGFSVKELVMVEIVDRNRPVIELKGDTEVTLCPNEKYQEFGFSAYDLYDGDLSSEVKVQEEEHRIVYRVTDSSLNQEEVVRTIRYEDKEGPILTLKGKEKVQIFVGNTYQEEGYSAIDRCDGDLSSEVKVSGKVNGNRVGSYVVRYEVTDRSGNRTVKERTVEVVPVSDTSSNGKGIIYLTFDDGPSSSITPLVLDILKKKGIVATFFVIHHDEALDPLIKREYQEGHTVALHSYTHNYGLIYQSQENYFADLVQIREQVFRLTGEYSNIIRFPGGSSNTVSRRYSAGIMARLTGEVLYRGYHYFDWNVDSGDGAGIRDRNKIYQNVVGSLSPTRENVVLMHDFEGNTGTLQALEDIIEYGLRNGYSFKKITMATPMVRHRVQN